MNDARNLVAAPIAEAALALADAACDLDWNKNGFPPLLRIQAICCVRDMHKLADALEAVGCGEARTASIANDPAGPGWAAVTGGLA